MNIGIDISSLVYDRGVSRYTSNLVKALAKDSNLKLHLYGASLRQEKKLTVWAKEVSAQAEASVKVKIQKLPPSLLIRMWSFGFNPILKFWPKLDLFHSWDWIQPPDKKLPLVSTIHDLAILKFPETAHPKVLKRHRKSWEILKKRKAHVIAVSQATKKDIVELLGISAGKIHVIYEALPDEIETVAKNMTDEKFEKIKIKLNLIRPFILFVGTREPRKNLKNLIKAWEPLSDTHDLIIAGEEGWDETSGNKDPQKNNKPKPRFLGKVSNSELVVLYSETACFAYPSLYEGFGLPILEAYYFGAPVVTSNISSMPEVAGNAAELVNPNSVTDITRGLKKIIDEDKQEAKQRLQKMIVRLHLFSWKKVARETTEVYKKVLREHE